MSDNSNMTPILFQRICAQLELKPNDPTAVRSLRAAQEVLGALNDIRTAASKVMNLCAASLAYDILQCVAEEVRKVKLEPCSDSGMDAMLFSGCQNDDAAHKFIEDYILNRMWTMF